MDADGFPQLDEPEAVRIMGFPFPNGLARCIADARRGGEIRFADLKMDDMPALSFQFMGPFEDVHYNKWRDFVCPFCYCIHQITLFREYSMIPWAPAFISFGTRSRTTLESTTVSTETQSELYNPATVGAFRLGRI